MNLLLDHTTVKNDYILSSALIASMVWSITGAVHAYNWYGVATRSNGWRWLLFFCSTAKCLLKSGDIWFSNSIREWHRWLGVAGLGLNSSSVDLKKNPTISWVNNLNPMCSYWLR